MKLNSLIAVFVVMFVAVGVFALSADDQKSLDAAEKSLASYTVAPYPQAAFWPLANRELLTGTEPATFQALIERIDKAAAQVTFKSPEDKQKQYNNFIVNAALWRFSGRFFAEGYKFAQEHGIRNPYFCLHAQKVGMSEAEELAGYIELFNRANKIDLWIFKQRVNRFSALLNLHKSEAEAKDILKKLNRAYSVHLVEDKAAFEPVVAMIRTLLETY